MIWFCLLTLLAITTLLLFCVLEIPFRKRRRRFQSRPTTDFDAWHETHYGRTDVSRQASFAVTDALAAEIRCDPSQLLPEDEVNGNLSVNPRGLNVQDSFELADTILESAVKDLGIDWPPENAEWRTIDDVIRALDAALKRRMADGRILSS